MNRVPAICDYIRQRSDQSLTLDRLSRQFSLSPAHLQRLFKRQVGVSPLEFAQACRMDQFKSALRKGASVVDALYASGFGSPSRVYERTAQSLGMTPRRYRQRGQGTRIVFTVMPCSLGQLLVAATDKGVCAVKLGDSAAGLEQTLREEFSDAQIERDDRAHRDWVKSIVAIADGHASSAHLPLDIQGTAFQKKVWQTLQKIPAGKTRTYAQVAKSIGQPAAVRAVASACGANPAALVIPCHRVVRTDGGLGGYHWGIERKQALLEQEGAKGKVR